MALTLYFNGAAADPASALVRSPSNNQAAPKPVFMLGDNPSLSLYVTDGAGGLDADSGATGVTPWLAICTPGGGPTGGTFWLGVSSATSGTLTSGKRYQIQTFVAGDVFTNVGAAANESGVIFTATGTTPTTWTNGSTLIEITTDVAYNASAVTLEAALEATQAVVGVSVTKSGDAGVWLVQWDSVGAVSLMTGGGSLLTPASAVVTSEIRAGSSTVTEQQLVRLTATPYALQTTWTDAGTYWTGRLDCNTRGLVELLDGAASVNSTLELQLVDGSGNIRTVGQVACLVRNEGIDEESTIPTPLPSYLTGAETLLQCVQNRYAVTALTGGGTALDGIVTGTTALPTVATNSLVCIELSTVLSFYELVTGTDAESSPSVIRPDDYASSTNERVWKLRGVSSLSATSYEAIAFSSAGNTDVTPAANSANHVVVATVTAGGGAFTRTVALLTANSSAGDVVAIRFDMPASTNPTIQVRNATSGGTLLTTINGEAVGIPLDATYGFNGTAWIELGAHYVE